MFRHEEVNCDVRQRFFNYDSVGVKISKIHSSLAKDRNSIQNLSLRQRDLGNMIETNRNLKLEGGDASAMFKYFNKINTDNHNVVHMQRLDENGVSKDVLWVDAQSRETYEEFGDVLCFDATYVTNQYELPFANFVGINHHGQTMLLGCALVSHEDAETHDWVFGMWLHCMGGKALQGFLTDQDAAMRKALRNAMSESCHRWCLRHNLKKFPIKIGSCARYQEFKVVLNNVIYDSLIEEFEQRWCAVISEYKLGEDEWLPCQRIMLFA